MYFQYLESSAGPIKIESDGNAICALTFCETAEASSGEVCPVLETCASELQRYFSGEKVCFSVPLHPRGTAFSVRVWNELAQVPYGTTLSYGELARRIGCGSARAVGGAVGRNPVPILIPCHRVLAAEGFLGGFSAGLERKRILLKLEGVSFREVPKLKKK